jgi:hypothetical protein
MSDADFDFELRRLFLGFGGAIAFLIILYAGRLLKIYVLGRRVKAVVAKIQKKEADPAEPKSRPRYSYVLEYVDRAGERRHILERQELAYQEFEVGDEVTAFVQSDRIAEILSWRRLLLSGSVITITFAAMIAAYYILLVQKRG